MWTSGRRALQTEGTAIRQCKGPEVGLCQAYWRPDMGPGLAIQQL